MQYQVTCNKCEKSFLINGEGGKEMHCTCLIARKSSL